MFAGPERERIPQGKKVLDVGAGSGILSLSLGAGDAPPHSVFDVCWVPTPHEYYRCSEQKHP